MSKCTDPSHPCNELRKNGHKGAAVIPFNYNTNDVLLGYERFGFYKYTYNFFAGGEDVNDNGCLIRTAYREFTEESGWEITFNNFLKIITCQKNNKFLIIPSKRGAVMFVAMVPNIDINALNNKITYRNSNPGFPFNLREMDHVSLFPLYSISNVALNTLSSWVKASLPNIKTFVDNNKYCNTAIVPAPPKVNPAIVPAPPKVNSNLVGASNLVNSSSKVTSNTTPNPNPNPIPIPNALSITINTSVPGYQTIKYKPDMTIKNIDKDERTIWFDPLVPLDQSVIDKVPENIKVLEFFNKGLYESLINAHGNKKPITLEQAKKSKIIDNNIQITLNTLFPTNGILYIKGEPYAIADVQWTKSDWKIDRKTKEIPEIDVNKISDPITFNAITKNQVLEGNKQLLMLPKDVIYGVNFNKETEQLSSVDREKDLIDKAKAAEDARLKAAADAKAKAEEDARLKAAAALEEARLKAEADAKAKAEEEARLRARLVAPPLLALEDAKPPPPVKPVLAIGDAKPPVTPPLLAIGDAKPPVKPVLAIGDAPPIVIEDIENIQMSEDYKPLLRMSQDSTKTLRTYFGSEIFYSMISMIFKYMTEEQKIFIQNIFKNTTNIDVKGLSANISKAAYNFTITGTKQISSGGVLIKKSFTDGLRVIANTGGGNCLFIAVADAINYYNYYNEIGNKILYNMYGNGNNLFTTSVLRNIVSTEIIKKFNSDEDFRKESLDNGEINVDLLNNIFEQIMLSPESISHENPEDYYNTTLIDTYKSHDNFFVIIPEVIANRNRPFELARNNDEIKKYIESDYYWADQNTINIINKILKLNIITLQNIDGDYTIPYPTIKSDDYDEWNKYLFLYYNQNHYELITFDYLMKVSSKVVRIKKTIFNRGSNILPPFYIIFLMFSIFYIKLLPDDKALVTLFTNFFKAIQKSFNNIITAPADKNIDNFITNFEKYFGPIRREILGGATTNRDTGSSRFLKKEDKQDNIQISFYITIDMELQKGTTLSKEQISNIKCIKGWNKVRKSFADFTGKKYVVPPVYENLSDKYNKKEDTDKDKDKDKNKNKNNDKNKNNTTKKITSGGDSRGRRRRKTMKYLK